MKYNRTYDFITSHIALGEAIQNFIENNIDMDIGRIRNKLRQYNIQVTGIPCIQEVVKVIRMIREQDNRLDHNDILIVAVALLDENSRGLITTDSEMIGNKAINNTAIYLGKNNFIVSDNPFGTATPRRRRRKRRKHW